jgi:DNA-binding NtrC family response regulator
MTPVRGRILIVDDEPLIRWSLHQRLAEVGHVILEAPDAPEALRAVREGHPDLVLLDYKLPTADGLSVLEEIHRTQPALPVIMVTAMTGSEIIVRAMKLGAVDYLTKPLVMDELALVIRRALESRRPSVSPGRKGDEAGEAGIEGIVCQAPSMLKVIEVVKKVATAGNVTALLRGETGVGKDLIAKQIHLNSARASNRFVSVNCSAIPDALMEAELFGHEKGAFTDARSSRDGLFAAAAGGTILLNEIGDMNYASQSKLLSVLEEHSFRPVGGTKDVATDVRVIAATNTDLETAMHAHRFREDLFYRLNVVTISIPPLRERHEDILPLSHHFLRTLGADLGRTTEGFTPEAERILDMHSWPGNVRELRNLVERILVLDGPEWIGAEHLEAIRSTGIDLPDSSGESAESKSESAFDRVERQLILEALSAAGYNQSRAARLLNITRDTLRYRLKKYGIDAGE